MNKELLISIKPEHLVNILNGEKTLELRKSVPKDFNGWVYIYVTKGKPYIRKLGENYFTECSAVDVNKLNGKIPMRFWFGETYLIQQAFNVYGEPLNQISVYDNKTYGWKAPKEQQEILKQLCLTEQQVLDYGKGKDLYAWHIKKLEIFDNPMELSDFYKTNLPYVGINEIKHALGTNNTDNLRHYSLTKAPQNYQFVYVKELENDNT